MNIWPAGTECPHPEYKDFKILLNQASFHFADDTGKEWSMGFRCIEQAVNIAINSQWPYWAMQRMFSEIKPLVTFDDFMGKYVLKQLELNNKKKVF